MTDTEAWLFTPMLGLAVLRVLALLLLPLAPLVAGTAATGRAPWRRPWTWLLADLAAVALGVLGAPLLLATIPADHGFDLAAIFQPGGPWDLSFAGFITQRVVPLLAAPLDLATALESGRAGPDVTRGTILFALAALPLVLGPALRRQDRAKLTGAGLTRAGLTGAGLTGAGRRLFLLLWASYATVYAVSVVAWTANRLNFWCFLVLFVASLLLRG